MELNILCNNVIKSLTCYIVLLAQVIEVSVDMILVQELALVDKENKVTLFNQSYN